MNNRHLGKKKIPIRSVEKVVLSGPIPVDPPFPL